MFSDAIAMEISNLPDPIPSVHPTSLHLVLEPVWDQVNTKDRDPKADRPMPSMSSHGLSWPATAGSGHF